MPPADSPIPKVASTLMLEPLVAQWMIESRPELGVPPFDLEPLPLEAALEAARRGDVALVVTGAAPPADWFAMPISLEPIAVIMNPANPVLSVDREELEGLFTGRITQWNEVAEFSHAVQPVIPFPGDEVRARFEDIMLAGLPAAPTSLLAPAPAAMLQLVGQEPGAIGYLLRSLVDGEVRTARVDGVLPGVSTVQQGQYSLAVQVIATAPAEPEGPVRSWLAWLQSAHSPESR